MREEEEEEEAYLADLPSPLLDPVDLPPLSLDPSAIAAATTMAGASVGRHVIMGAGARRSLLVLSPVCVCVCVRERERRGAEDESIEGRSRSEPHVSDIKNHLFVGAKNPCGV